MNWKEVAAKARQNLDDSIPKDLRIEDDKLETNIMRHCSVDEHKDLISPREREITSLDATQLLQAIKNKKYKAVEVFKAFCTTAAVVHQLTNSLTEYFPEEGLQRAIELDEYYERTGKLFGSLHGLPISIKDHLELAGHLANMGFVAWADRRSPAKEDGIVKALRDEGAVFYIKTAMPMSGMVLETASNLWGNVRNPYNRRLTSGGSSGGEAVMVAMGGSAIGIGTDTAGSIRCPAAFCGLYALKPTCYRFAYTGMLFPSPSQISIAGCPGPIAKSMADVKMLSKFLVDSEPWESDPNVVPIPWKNDVTYSDSKKLCIGVIRSDGAVTPHPPVLRAIDLAVERLREDGHEVIELDLPFDAYELMEQASKMYFLSGFKECKELCAQSGEPLIPALTTILERYNIKEFGGSVNFKVNAYRNGVRKKFLEMWKSTASKSSSGGQIEAIVTANSACCSFPHNFLPWWGYTTTYNVLDVPSLVIPLKDQMSDPKVDLKDNHYEPLNDWDKSNYEIYDPELFKDIPLNIQLVGRRYLEEELIAIGEVVDSSLNKK
ncbi:uncharacterized protein PRCAT00005769001 [Priceomyces carsonii]|uniref:uncharacterized protein n=1 Tax=Priceomyces carsonii TaxID=28549 RepID=UPI002EDB87A0|nr:unnamed protein product [Priceomyces carsonii]